MLWYELEILIFVLIIHSFNQFSYHQGAVEHFNTYWNHWEVEGQRINKDLKEFVWSVR